MLKDFIRSHVSSISRKPASPPPPRIATLALTIEDVARNSPAWAIGVRVGDLLLDVNNGPATRLDFDRLASVEEDYEYRFYLFERGELVRATCTGIPLGAEYRKTDEAIIDSADNPNFDQTELVSLWESQNWDGLLKAATTVVERAGKGLTSKLAKLARGKYQPTPAELLRAAAQFELGRANKAMPVFEAFIAEEYKWTLDYRGIGEFYRAKDLIFDGYEDEGIELMEQAFGHFDCDRFADELEKLTGDRPRKEDEWAGAEFPVSYVYPELEVRRRRDVDLEKTLERMEPHQLLIICNLATYRGNGPYNEFMYRYWRIAKFMRHAIYGLHVLTAVPERPPNREYFFTAEDFLREQSLPFRVAYEEDDEVTETLAPRVAPFFLLVNSSGTIVRSGGLSEAELWTSIVQQMKSAAG